MKKSPLSLALALALALISCGPNKEKVRFLGQWTGQFTIDKIGKGPDSPMDRKHHMLRGYISIVLNKNKYTMHMEGEQQQVDIKGFWTYKDNQVTLSPAEVNVKSDGGDKGYDPNLKYVPDEELHQAYLKKFTFNLSKDGSTLQGLTTTIAFLEGVHAFKRE